MERTMAYYGNNYADLPVGIRGVFEGMQTGRLYVKDQMIYTQGEMAGCFYYLKEGQAKIFFSSPDGMEKTLTVVGAGAILGEAAFLTRCRAYPPQRHCKGALLSQSTETACLQSSAKHRGLPCSF